MNRSASTIGLESILGALCLALVLSGCSAVKILDGELPDLLTEKVEVHTTPYPVYGKPYTTSDHTDPERHPKTAKAKEASPKAPTATTPAPVLPPAAPVEHVATAPAAAPIPVNTKSAIKIPTPAPLENGKIPDSQPALVSLPLTPANAAPTVSADKPVEKTIEKTAEKPPVEELVASPAHAEKVYPDATVSANEPEKVELTPEERRIKWHKDRDALITALQEELRERRQKNSHDEELPILEKELRLLHLAAGDVEGAAEKIDALPAAEQEAFRHLMYGLSTWQSRDEGTRPILRNAKIQRALRDAAHELAKTSKLDLRNLTFCEKVDSYGWFTEFPRNTLKPGEQVILYVEVENFAAEARGKKEFETELQGSYQVFDMAGKMVAERKLPLDRETCRNYRRDYFLAYRIYLPENMAPGKHRLELTVEDLKAVDNAKGAKFGTGVIEFTVAD